MEKDISSITILNVIGKFVKEPKSEGYVNESTKQNTKKINNRYYSAKDRQRYYWGLGREYGGQELSNLLPQAKEGAIIKILKRRENGIQRII